LAERNLVVNVREWSQREKSNRFMLAQDDLVGSFPLKPAFSEDPDAPVRMSVLHKSLQNLAKGRCHGSRGILEEQNNRLQAKTFKPRDY
jgi:hypothetical protein